MKTEQTLALERLIWRATHNQGTFGCFEVTIGWFGSERVDYMTYNTKGEFRCYEIKVTKSDFHSKAANTFIGHFNYYVMPPELYAEVKNEIPAHIGVYTGETCVKKARRQELGADIHTLKDSMIRSLCREVQKQIASGRPTLIEQYKREVAEAKRNEKFWYSQYQSVMLTIVDRYGENWDAGPIPAREEDTV
ncbi:hypothetical protein [Clostridium sp. D33t1_170424_F3]|uniref:hypothetical protein n=1 Tax=Clostridium sp. D33t1_170424_F3 TaxID=2787099 RepID=UPI0018A91CF5|nr:hypothetical protein [Clostridium sp. D33t1_170424_F3]